MTDTLRTPGPGRLSHRLTKMAGRDPNQAHRAATPLELLFDLTFVVAFGQAGGQLAHLLAEGHVGAGVGGFAFAMFAICWAWLNFTWFASAYDTDDWLFRVLTMVQMIGVLILALGLPAMFHSLDEAHTLGNQVMVAGYVVMRVAMVSQWVRAARQDPARRPTAMGYVRVVILAQIGWVALATVDPPLPVAVPILLVFAAVEFVGPWLAERKSDGTPWHPHHIAERFGLLVIIAIGETLFGTIASGSAIIEHDGWSAEAVVVLFAGVGLAFALWWNYFILPSGPVLARHRERSRVWSYTHILMFASIAATGAGIHVAAYVVGGTAEVGVLAAVLATAVPVLIFSVVLFGIYTYLVRVGDPFHIGLFAGELVLLGASVLVAALGGSLGVCLILVTMAPVVVVVGYETIGHRHEARALERALK